MKKFKKLLVTVAYIGTLLAPFGMAGIAHAQQAPQVSVSCSGFNGEPSFVTSEGCDLSVDKQVSINGGAYTEADTSADAAQAHVGDTVTWKIIVTNMSSEGLTPTGTVYVSDVLPAAGVSYVSSSATAGNYQTTGFFANNWVLPLLDGSSATTLPATLTLTTTSTATGLFQNTATLSKFDNGHCDGGCVYNDADSSNNSNDAWIDPSAKPLVLGASTTVSPTLVNTGSGTTVSLIAGGLVAVTLGVAFSGRLARKQS